MTRRRMRSPAWLLVLLLVPVALLHGGRPQPAPDGTEEDPIERVMQAAAARAAGRFRLPEPIAPPAEFSPFGTGMPFVLLEGEAARGRLLTLQGHVDWDAAADAVARRIPAGLRAPETELRRSERGTLHPGLNYLRLAETDVATRGADAVQAEVSAHARILGWLPERTLVAWVEARDLEALRRLGGIDRSRAIEPYQKLSPALGALPRLSRREAQNPDLLARVTFVPGLGGDRAIDAIRRMPGVTEVVPDETGGGLQLRVRFDRVGDLARREDVLVVEPVHDFVLANAENVPTIQAGSAEDARMARPFDDAGIDGGGIDTNGDGMRLNDGSDSVPPQIVAITDNGISLDTPSFAQTSSETIIAGFPLGPLHRKIQAIQSITDSGTSCDAPLSGAGTHGNVVASVIAAYPSFLGAYMTRSGIGGPTEPRNENLDGVARGARIIVQDAGTAAQCTLNSLVEQGGNITPGSLLDRLTAAVSAGGTQVHLSVFPFGIPSFGPVFTIVNGTYPAEAAQIDTFLYNNRDYMVFVPAGNNGGNLGTGRLGLMLRTIPDLFNGTAADENPNFPSPIQVTAPATAKNIVAVGAGTADCFTYFGTTDCEQTIASFTSRGPATPQSLRMAPILTAPAFDLIGTPYAASLAVFRSNDNDNLPPIDAQLDEANFGTSFAAASLTGAGALIRDYFAQGFYPTGSRGSAADRMPGISGALVKAALAASADFNEGGIATQGQDNNERNLRRTRCLDLGTVSGIGGPVQVDIMCNSEQGYGRAVLTNVLPLANWSDSFVLHPASLLAREYPAAGLLVWDALSTGEPLIDNTTRISVTHTFRVASPNLITKVAPAPDAGAVAVAPGQLRIALSWPDPPSPSGSGGPLINDLDLVVESPGPDGSLATAADNIFYDGNRYDGGRNNASFDQWSLGRTSTTPAEKHDKRNNTEAVHLSADTNADFAYGESPLYPGLWRITVKRGLGGAIPGQVTIAAGPDPDEDDNGNGRLDPGEDENGNGLLDPPGQPYALVVSGPVFAGEAAPPLGAQTFPLSSVNLDRATYDCGSDAVARIFDTTPDASAALSSSATTFTVLDGAGAVLDTETGIGFTLLAAGATASASIPVRLAGPAVSGNGILEADSGQRLRARYAPAGQPAIEAVAPVRCSPDLVFAAFTKQAGQAVGDQVVVQGGCDDDPFPDSGEVVSYGVALRNRSRDFEYTDAVATLTPTGPGASAVRVLDSPRELGILPMNGVNAVFFQVYVDPAALAPLPSASRVVTMRLDLDSSSRGTRLARQTYSFTHALDSDKEERRYSTDYLAGGRDVRDLNRNGVIDRPGQVDPFLGFILPAEDVTFASLFSGSGAPAGHFTNELGEDLDLSGAFTGVERNILPNLDGVGQPLLDRGILNSGNPADPNHRAPWNFDNNSGGWFPFRHGGSIPTGVSGNPLWEYRTNFLCGFQTAAGPNKFGIWHTGDGDPSTPSGVATACDNHSQPNDPSSPGKVESLFDILESPIVAKVNQAADARGFPWTVEFQRLGLNLNIQLVDGYAGGGINIDNDVEVDAANSLLGQHTDAYYMRRAGGWPYGIFRFAGQYFPGAGIDPATTAPYQRTFGPFEPGLPVEGDETGFPGATQNTNPDSSTPIPTAIPDFLAFPPPGAALAGVCTGGAGAGAPCAPGVPGDPCVVQGGVCTPQGNTVAGPVRNFDTTLVGYEGGFASVNDVGAPENFFFFTPGRAGTRWQIGIGFWALEGSTGNTDYGVGIDDVVFEWNEWHPEDEGAVGATPACARFGTPGQPGGGQCAAVTVDRTRLYECEETIEITVHDVKCTAIGSGATVPLGGACTTHAQCGAGGTCTAALASVEVAVITNSDAALVPGGDGLIYAPTTKRFTLPAVPGQPGLFRGRVPFTTLPADAAHVHASSGSDDLFRVYYFDPLCDGDRDGQAGENTFDNADGDGIPDASDKCPGVYNPLQEDADGDGYGDLCDNCPTMENSDQADGNVDGVGDACEYDDIDGDGAANNGDNCPDVRNPNQSDIDVDGRGDLCDTLKTSGVTFGTSAGAADCVAGLCTRPGDAIGDACATDQDCIRSCNNNVCTQGNSGSAGGFRCIGGAGNGNPCTVAGDCAAPGVCSANFVSPTPKVGQTCATHASCYVDVDRDADGVIDASDNCVLVPNGPLLGPNNQLDSDLDGLGNACDGDCAAATETFRCRANGAACPLPDTTQPVCGDAFGLGNFCQFYVDASGACSAVDDDADADGVGDAADSCPVNANPRIVAGGPQPDRDRDGRGDACDPPDAFDDTGDGVPDDVVTFQGAVACRTQPLASLAILAATYLDLDGDHDEYPDTGERGRVSIQVRNNGPALQDAVFTLTSSDPDVACITESQIRVASLANGATIVLGSLDPGQPGFTFVASNALQAPPPPAPAPTIVLGIEVTAAGRLGTSSPVAFSLLADLDSPFGPQVFTLGADGVAGTPDDGTIVEGFDLDRDGDTKFTVRDTFLQPIAPGVYRGSCSNAPLQSCVTAADCPASPPGAVCDSGAYLRGSDTGTGLNRIAAVACGGFSVPPSNPGCILDPDYPMDWHLHCPPGVTSCPNLESGTCVGNCSFNTPANNGRKAHSLPNSLHMGAHFDPNDALAGDTVHFRMLAGFMSAPINLAIAPRPGDLDLSFFHITRLMDNNGTAGEPIGFCMDCADVQIQVDQDADPAVDAWGFWDKLVPYQNVYEHKPMAFSHFGSYYCNFTPADTGAAPPNPRGVHETLCFPLGAWSHCGSTIGTVPAATVNCTGPGEVDPSGVGVWVQTRFHLDPYIGQRIRVRWIADTWFFGGIAGSYWEQGGTWAATQEEDGWWIDDIRVTGTVTQQVTPLVDNTPRTGTCPIDKCNAAVGDMGTAVVLAVTGAAGNPLDGVTGIPTSGAAIRVGAAGSSFPGGCSDGHAEYQFLRDGAIVQSWSGNPSFADSPERTARYTALVRCSSDTGCTSAVGASIDLPVRTGDGGDVFFGVRSASFDPGAGVRYYRGACSAGAVGAPCNIASDCGAGGACVVTATTADDVTALSLWSASDDGLDVVRGVLPAPPPNALGTRVGAFWYLPGLGPCFHPNLSPTAAGTGFNYAAPPLGQAQDPNAPPGGVIYYQASANNPSGATVNAFGCPSPAICSNIGWCAGGTNRGGPCTTSAADCPGGGSCVPTRTTCSTEAGTAGLGGCGHHPTCAGGSNDGALCQSIANCPGGMCQAPTAAQQAAEGQICLTLTGAPLAPPPYGSCPPAGHPKRLVSATGGPACP